jgi:hypothetical protein
MTDWRHFGGLWLLAAAAGTMGMVRRSASTAWLAFAAGGYLAVLTFSYVASSWVPWEPHLLTSYGRLVDQVVPVAALLIALQLPDLPRQWSWRRRARVRFPAPSSRDTAAARR